VEGAFDSRELIKANISKWKMQNDTPTTEEDPYIMFDQTISRYQIWIGSEKCKGDHFKIKYEKTLLYVSEIF
jgi:hypothetical protein